MVPWSMTRTANSLKIWASSSIDFAILVISSSRWFTSYGVQQSEDKMAENSDLLGIFKNLHLRLSEAIIDFANGRSLLFGQEIKCLSSAAILLSLQPRQIFLTTIEDNHKQSKRNRPFDWTGTTYSTLAASSPWTVACWLGQ